MEQPEDQRDDERQDDRGPEREVEPEAPSLDRDVPWEPAYPQPGEPIGEEQQGADRGEQEASADEQPAHLGEGAGHVWMIAGVASGGGAI